MFFAAGAGFTSLCKNVPTMTRVEAEQKFRFPWKMPLAIYEPRMGLSESMQEDDFNEDDDEEEDVRVFFDFTLDCPQSWLAAA